MLVRLYSWSCSVAVHCCAKSACLKVFVHKFNSLGVVSVNSCGACVCVCVCGLGTIADLKQSTHSVCCSALCVCAHIQRDDAARAPILYPIMLLSCPMV